MWHLSRCLTNYLAEKDRRGAQMKFSDSCYGVRQVYPSAQRPLPEGKEISLDVILVHGLNGHAQRSFSHPKTGVYWPCDLLPRQVPTARVLTYGYHASVGDISDGQNVLDIANHLMVNLKDYRREEAEKHRDIVFVCHSLGGIIVKKAILLHQSSDEGKTLRNSIVGIMFMGTPHCGSDLANYGGIIARIASAFVSMPKLLLKTLAKNSSILYDVSREFATVVHDLNLKLISFYEINPFSPPWWGGPSFVVVEKRSAVLGLPGEEIIAVHADHRDICRFESSEDINYRPVWLRIEDFANEAMRKAKERESLDSDKKPVHGMHLYEALVARDIKPDPLGISVATTEKSGVSGKHWKVPYLPCASFTGRTALLQEMADYFMRSTSENQRRFAIHGLGGAGKTQLALTYAFRQRPKYSGVFFLDADSESTLRNGMERLHDELELGCPRDKVGSVKRWFDIEANTNVNWLLIFDNADDLSSYQLTDYFPLSTDAHIIITSRDPDARELTPGGLLLDMMEPTESRDLLISRAGLANPTGKDLIDIAEITEKLSHLPLAIDQAGAYIRTRKCSPSAYLRQFTTQQARLLKFSPKISAYNGSVLTAWEVSFTRLERESPITAKLLLLFCYLDSRRIASSLLRCITEPTTKADDDGEAVEVLAEENGVSPDMVDLVMDEDAFEMAVGRMEGLSLVKEFVEMVGGRDERVFSLHPLVAFCGRSRATQAQKREAAEQAICLISHSFPELSTDFSTPEFARLTRSHLPRCLSYIDQPAEFGCTLGHLAPKLLLIIYSIRTVQLLGIMTARSNDEIQLLATAEMVLKKYKTPYLEAVATFLHVRTMGGVEEAERVITEYLEATGTEHGIDPNNPAHGGRFNAALGDLKIHLEGLKRALNRPSPPTFLLHAWAPLKPAAPSTSERKAKWYRDRTVGSYLLDAGLTLQAEEHLTAHVAEIADSGTEGSDEHLAGTDHLANLYMRKGDWNRAGEVLVRALGRARERGRGGETVHVFYSEVLLLVVLMREGKYDDIEQRGTELVSLLRISSQLPDLAATPLYAALSILARCAHVRCQYPLATARWNECITLGRSMDWSDYPDLTIPVCAVEAIRFESGERGACGMEEFEEWKTRLWGGGGGEEFWGLGVGEDWKELLEEKMRGFVKHE